MAKLCDICGDTGDVGALTTCPLCKVGCEHRYCMRKPCTVVPADWCCEMCRSAKIVSSNRGLKKRTSEAVTHDHSSKVPQYSKESTQKMFCKGARGNWHEKPVEKGKTKYLWTNEVNSMPSGDKKGEPKRVGPISSKPSKSVVSDHNTAQMKPKRIIHHVDSSYMVKSNLMFSPSKYSEQLHPTKSGNTHSSTSVQKVKELKAIVTPVNEHCQTRQISSVKDVEASYAKKQKVTGETSSAYQMSRHCQTYDIPQTDATPSPNTLTSTKVIERTSGNLQKLISKELCADLPYVETSYAKKQKVTGETSSAYQMSRHSQTCVIPQTDATPSPNALTSTMVIERTSGNLQKLISKESCADLPSNYCQSPMSETDATVSPTNALTSTGDTVKTNAKSQKTISKELCADLLSFYCQPPMSGFKLIKKVEPKKVDAENVVHTVDDFFKKAAAKKTLPTDPALVASWMGSFVLKDEKTSMGFRAYPTSEGLPKVKEFSKKMPEVLEFNLCPYKDFLRTVFKGHDPDEEDIGLYFFPDNMERSSAYISHLEKLSEQFFMRSCVDGVELLVFTSKVLHKDYRMRNKYDFLWGIYRRRHGKLKDAVERKMAVDMDINAEDVDMEVDMVGGEIVGRVDVVFPKMSTERT